MKRSTQAGIAVGLVAIATAFGVALINRRGADADLARTLALRSDSTALDLALRSRDRTQFVSAIERNDATTGPAPADRPSPPAPVRRQVRAAPAVTRAPARVASPVPTEVAEAEAAPMAAPQGESAPAPVETQTEAAPAPARTPDHYPAPRPTPTRKGGYWSTGDVIRNAPFPINP